MIKQEITYEDYNGIERTEDFYFNLNKYELVGMKFTDDGGDFQELVQKIIKEKDQKKIMDMFQTIIMKAYGEKSPDGKRFIKKDPIDGHLLAEDFLQTAAYEKFFFDLLDADNMSNFIEGLVPKDLLEATKNAEKDVNSGGMMPAA